MLQKRLPQLFLSVRPSSVCYSVLFDFSSECNQCLDSDVKNNSDACSHNNVPWTFIKSLKEKLEQREVSRQEGSESDYSNFKRNDRILPASSATTVGFGGSRSEQDIAPLKWNHVYVDGSCKPKSKYTSKAGFGIYWGEGYCKNTSGVVSGKQTNARAELTAALYALRQAREHDIENLVIHTDSEYAIRTATKFIGLWKENAWQRVNGQEIAHLDLVKQIDSYLNIENFKVKWEYVQGHNGNYGNEMADKLANEAVDDAPLRAYIFCYFVSTQRLTKQRTIFGVFWGEKDSKNCFEMIDGSQSNRALLTAALTVLRQHASTNSKGNVAIVTDSDYVLNAIDCMDYHKRRNWLKANGEAVQNVDLIKQIDLYLSKSKQIKFVSAEESDKDNIRIARQVAQKTAHQSTYVQRFSMP